MKILENYNLKTWNTFQLNVNTKKLLIIEDEKELVELKKHIHHEKYLILGGGSNVLFLNDFDGVIVKNEIKGKKNLEENDDAVIVSIKSGEVWHDVVMWSVENNWNGIENLALIPGTVGAAPVQNIGAYGVEIKDVLESVTFYHLEKNTFQTLKNNACRFSYRDSIFKQELKNKIFITEIVLKLKTKNHQYVTNYGNIVTELKNKNKEHLSPKIIAEVVIGIRTSKLPDPAQTGNAGSFFKNPEVPTHKYFELKEKFPDIIAFPVENGNYKIAAGWMIEKCGLKGYEHKGAAVHDKQALVLINKNNATGQAIYELSQIIIQKILDTFAIQLEPEVNIIQ